MEFSVRQIKKSLVQWIRNWFEKNGKDCNAVVGISGGKDSSVCAALCVEALGKDRVIGVMMPNGQQSDIDDSRMLVQHLGIKHYTVDISGAVGAVRGQFYRIGIQESEQTVINLPPRIHVHRKNSS